MITTLLSGGLGNQFFQYAAGRALCLKRGAELRIDQRSYVENDRTRKYMLNNYAIQAKVSRSPYIDLVIHLQKSYRMKRAADNVFREKSLRFDSALMRQADNTTLIGYWQSEKYFATIAEKIRTELRCTKPMPEAYDSYRKAAASKNSIFLHVRRGDYLSDSVSKIYAYCSPGYYREAIKIIQKTVKNPHLLIFSDDMGWTRDNLKFNIRTTYVETREKDARQELELMRACRHAIIANSSYGWWGAWLGEYSGKIVIAPKKWFQNRTLESVDIVPKRWIKI